MRDLIQKILNGSGLKLPENLSLSKLINVKIQVNKDDKDVYIKNENTINIYCPKEDAEKIVAEIAENFSENAPKGSYLIEADVNKTIALAEESLSKSNTTRDYFKELLKPDDLAILKASIMIKESYDKGICVESFRQQLRDRYGNRASTISNLYSAGYFDTIIKPLNEELCKLDDYSVDLFRERFDTLIGDFPNAIFVSRATKSEELKVEIISKATQGKTYGISSINIHAIGRNNVEKVNNTLSELMNEGFVSSDLLVYEELDKTKAVSVKFLLKNWNN